MWVGDRGRGRGRGRTRARVRVRQEETRAETRAQRVQERPRDVASGGVQRLAEIGGDGGEHAQHVRRGGGRLRRGEKVLEGGVHANVLQRGERRVVARAAGAREGCGALLPERHERLLRRVLPQPLDREDAEEAQRMQRRHEDREPAEVDAGEDGLHGRHRQRQREHPPEGDSRERVSHHHGFRGGCGFARASRSTRLARPSSR